MRFTLLAAVPLILTGCAQLRTSVLVLPDVIVCSHGEPIEGACPKRGYPFSPVSPLVRIPPPTTVESSVVPLP